MAFGRGGMSVLDQIDDALGTIRGLVQDLRDQHPDEVALIDAQITDLHARRALLLGWCGDQLGDWAIVREVANHRGVTGAAGWGQSATQAWWTCEAMFTVGEMAEVREVGQATSTRYVVGHGERFASVGF